MTASSQPHTLPETATHPFARQLRRHRLAALALVVVGGLLLAANLGLLPPAAQQVVAWGGAAIFLAAGAWLLLAGWPRAASGPTFRVARGEATSSTLTVQTGTADLRLAALPAAEALAEGWLPTPRGPGVAERDGVAHLTMTPRLAVPLLPGRAWAVNLAPELPWSLAAESSLGDFELDLSHVMLTTLRLRSAMGHVDVTLPATGQAELSVRLGLGNLTVRVPETMAVKVKVTRGRLATLRPDARRFVELTPGEWTSPLYAVSPARCTLTVALWAGDLTLI